MCSVCLCVTRQCHCVPAGQQIPPDHSSEWALIPLGLFMSLQPLSTAAGWECGPGMLTDQTIAAPPLLPSAATTHTHSRSRQNITRQLHQNSAHLLQFHTNQNTATPLLSYTPKLWLTSVKTHMSPCRQLSSPHFMCIHPPPPLPSSVWPMSVSQPVVFGGRLVYPFQWKHWDSSHCLPWLENVMPLVGRLLLVFPCHCSVSWIKQNVNWKKLQLVL